MNGTTPQQPECLHPGHPEACQFPARLNELFHWPICVYSDTDEFSHIDCDYCGTGLWDSYKPENNRRTENGYLLRGFDFSTNLDFLYKAVMQHMSDCDKRPGESQ